MLTKTEHNWIEPLDYARVVSERNVPMVFLYSSLQATYSGQKSILAYGINEEITGDDFVELEKILSSDKDCFANAWFGYLGYELNHSLEDLPKTKNSFIDSARLWIAKFSNIIVFDHTKKLVTIYGDDKAEITPKEKAVNKVEVLDLKSNMTKDQYLKNVSKIKTNIENGVFYQANLTRKFYGKIKKNCSHFEIFTDLCEISPAPYSAYINTGKHIVLSSSPERFLHVDNQGNAKTRPIKGSARRYEDKAKDEESLKSLQNSEKDKAENLMIVDLSRNDLSRSCVVGSIEVDELFKIESYKTVHHMSSNVIGKKQDDKTALDLVKGCFPPGSMTGTPKIKAMQICAEIEKMNRGIYSGAIGWLGGDGSVDLSVVIRTIIFEGDNFEFQVGGAIVADSKEEDEFEETITKAKAICKALSISLDEMRAL